MATLRQRVVAPSTSKAVAAALSVAERAVVGRSRGVCVDRQNHAPVKATILTGARCCGRAPRLRG